MGTKNAPGEFDCYAKAAPDEPMFILLARDGSASLLTHIWAAIRQGNPDLARQHFESLMAGPGSRYAAPAPPHVGMLGTADYDRQQDRYETALRECEQADEATQCADAMIAWHMQNRQAA